MLKSPPLIFTLHRRIILALVVGAGLITLLYMTRTWHLIFKQPPSGAVKIKPKGDSQLAPVLLIILCVVLGLYATPLLELAGKTVVQISEPQIYIQAVLGG